MELIFEKIVAAWPYICLVAAGLAAVAKIVNTRTPHSSEVTPAWKQVLLAVIDVLDLIKRTPAPSKPVSLAATRRRGRLLDKAMVLALAIPLLGGCGSWMQNAKLGLEGAHVAAVGLAKIAKPYYQTKCMSEAITCLAEKNKVCRKYDDCDEERSKVFDAIDTALYAVVVGYTALGSGDEEETLAQFDLAKHAIVTARTILRVAGAMKRGSK